MGIDKNNVPKVYECTACTPNAHHLEIEAAINIQEGFLKSKIQIRASKSNVHAKAPQTKATPVPDGGVGLALGLFSLVLMQITDRVQSTMKTSAPHIAKKIPDLRWFKMNFEMEEAKFKNIWYTCMSRADVPIKPNEDLSQETLEKILSCLHPSAVNNFVDGCQELIAILRKLMKKLKRYNENMVSMIIFL